MLAYKNDGSNVICITMLNDFYKFKRYVFFGILDDLPDCHETVHDSLRAQTEHQTKITT